MRTLNRLVVALGLATLGLGLALPLKGSSLEYTVAQGDGAQQPAFRDDDLLSALAATITVSGTVNGPSGPVEGVWISVGSPQESQTTTTNTSGFYSVGIETSGRVWFDVRPAVSTRLAQVNLAIDGVAASFTQNFTVTSGYLLSLRPTGSGGVPISGDPDFDVQPLTEPLSEQEWYALDWDDGTQRYQAVLPPDIYYVTAHRPPAGYYETTQAFDLRTADKIADMPLNTTYVHPVPYDPPDASKITIGPVDGLGEALVTGTAGAALPLTSVVLVNLNASHQANTVSEADGSFSARIFAPPGSAIVVKHRPAIKHWPWGSLDMGVTQGLTDFPGTILHVSLTHTDQGGDLPFATAGAVHSFFDDDITTRNYVGAAWAVTGTLGPGDSYAPGDPFQITGTLRLYSRAITATTDVNQITVHGFLQSMMVSNQEGRPVAPVNYFLSTMLTPSGFPIQRQGLSSGLLGTYVGIDNLHYLGDHIIEGDFAATSQVPLDWPLGVYQPWIWLQFDGVPISTHWLAAYMRPFTPDHAFLPPITVGSVDPPHLIWRLLMNDVVQGIRGTGAQEDQGTFELAPQIVSQGAPYYVPPVDVRTGQPITYRLEPFLPTISYTDRRMPRAPLIPLKLPGGALHVVVQEPDGTLHDLGAEPFAQSFVRTETTRDGAEINPATIQLGDVYSLKVDSDRFRVTFEQYGHHVITMTGFVNDIWGNNYAGGGTYDVWVAHPLDIDPGVLPGTPLAVGDAFNPTVQFYPRVPAEVSLNFTLHPYSNPALAEAHTRTGQAGPYGYFGSADPIPLMEPGEYRVDLMATYSEADGTLYMGTMTWGGVVMTPDTNADLIAHGRRGVDALPSIPGSAWFVSCRDLSLGPASTNPHTLNPYFNGDMIWSRFDDAPGECPAGVKTGGDSLILGASVQDTVGVIQTAIVTRVARINLELAPPGTITDRVAAAELPLFISTRSGRPPQFVLGQIGETIPGDVDQIAYSYSSSQRPGVRVREVVAEDNESGGYWRLDTLYDDQLGVGVQGDQPNDFKFQYIGAVYRDLYTGHSEYLGQGTGWIFIPNDDPTGTRVMPPFAGYGAWTTEGGPILTLKGKDIHIFILPTGTRPGALLETGDAFRFGGHIMPTLDSRVAFTVTSPGGTPHHGGGQANAIGYFYDPADDFVVDEPGLWSVDVRVWHDVQIGDGETVLCATISSEPCPSGDVLGSDNGRYWFYVVPDGGPRLNVSSPPPGFLSIGDTVAPITITGSLPAGLSGATVDYTVSMPGYILEHGQVTPSGDTYQIVFDPATLHQDFPNLDLVGRGDRSVARRIGGLLQNPAGLADTFAIGLLLRGQSGGDAIYRGNTITVQGEQVFIGDAPSNSIYLPLILQDYL